MVDVSVILCCHNGEATVARALDSAFAQTMPATAYEVIFVDDGSTDGTANVVEPYVERHPNLHYVRLAQNAGLPNACNIGLKRAKGRYVIRLDADDMFEPSILDMMVRPLEEDVTDLVYSDRYELVASTGEFRLVSMRDFNLFRLTAAGVAARRDLVLDIGGYRPFFWEEYDLYMRYSARSGRPFSYIPTPLYRYVRHSGGAAMTGSRDDVQRGWDQLIEIWGEPALRRFGWDPKFVETGQGT